VTTGGNVLRDGAFLATPRGYDSEATP